MWAKEGRSWVQKNGMPDMDNGSTGQTVECALVIICSFTLVCASILPFLLLLLAIALTLSPLPFYLNFIFLLWSGFALLPLCFYSPSSPLLLLLFVAIFLPIEIENVICLASRE